MGGGAIWINGIERCNGSNIIVLEQLTTTKSSERTFDFGTTDQYIIFGEQAVGVGIKVKLETISLGVAHKTGATIIQIPGVVIFAFCLVWR